MKISHIMCILRILTDLYVIRQSVGLKNTFADIVYNVLVVKKILIEHKETPLKIIGKQSVKLKSHSIKFKNHFKQLAVPFKIYADFESVLKEVKSNDKDNNASYTEKYQDHIPCSFAYKVICIDDRFSMPIVFTEKKMQSMNLFKQFLKSMIIAKK